MKDTEALPLMKPKSDHWLLEQARTIGATAAATVCGENPYESIHDLWPRMRAAVKEGAVPQALAANDHMRRGLLTEPLHLALLEEATGRDVIPHDQDQFVYHMEMPFAHDLPDGWIDQDGLTLPVQLKCPTSRNWHKIRLEGLHGQWLIGAQHTLAMHGAPMLYFSVLNPESMRLLHFPVLRDDALIAVIVSREHEFYRSVLDGVPPPVEPQEKIELPEIGGELVKIEGAEALATAAAWLEVEQLEQEIESLREAAKRKMLTLAANHAVFELPGLRVYNRELPGRATFDSKAMKKAHPEIDYAPFEKQGKPYRTFRTYHIGG